MFVFHNIPNDGAWWYPRPRNAFRKFRIDDLGDTIHGIGRFLMEKTGYLPDSMYRSTELRLGTRKFVNWSAVPFTTVCTESWNSACIHGKS
jgi:hypothetical protein